MLDGIKKVYFLNIRRFVDVLKLIDIKISIKNRNFRIVRRVREERKAEIINRVTIIKRKNREGLRGE